MPDPIQKPKPFITNDPNHVRFQQYSDSLNLYNSHKYLLQDLSNAHNVQTGIGEYKTITNSFNSSLNFDDLLSRSKTRPNSGYEIDKVSNERYNQGTNQTSLHSINDFFPSVVNELVGSQLYSNEIKPQGVQFFESDMNSNVDKASTPTIFKWDKNNDDFVPLKDNLSFLQKMNVSPIGDVRGVADYSNVEPQQEVIYKPDDVEEVGNNLAKNDKPVRGKQMNRMPVLSGLLHSGTLDKDLADVVMNPLFNKRKTQTMYATDPQGTKGQYPIGERVYRDGQWKDRPWSKEDQKISMQLLRKNYIPKISL